MGRVRRIAAVALTVAAAALAVAAALAIAAAPAVAAPAVATAPPAPLPAAGASARQAGTRLTLRASVSDLTPAAGQRVTVTVRARGRGGRSLAGVSVTVRWGLPSAPAVARRTTGRAGRVRFSRRIDAEAGTIVRVVVTARRGALRRRTRLTLTVVGGAASAGRLAPDDLFYEGAFRLPGPSGDSSWGWSGDGLTYYPDGDPGGGADGYAGSLFGIGHDWQHELSEVSVPAPEVSAGKDVTDLPRARTLQPFADVRGDLYPDLGSELLRADVEYLPARSVGASGRLFLCWGRHMQLGEANATHMACGLDLSRPAPQGPWSIGGREDYVTCDYLCAVDPAWSAAYAPGMALATGRFRDGGQGTMGPSLLLYDPEPGGALPAVRATLPALPVLFYDSVGTGEHTLRGYHHSDEWSGAAWVTPSADAVAAGDGRSAVVFAGTKGTGACWYGFADGTVWPDDPPYPDPLPPGERGWWSTGFAGQLLFYDPEDLAAVAAGSLPADLPQPFAVLDLDPYLFAVRSGQQKHHVAAIAFDRVHGRLFVMEPLADGDDSIVHVWSVRPATSATAGSATPARPAVDRVSARP